MATLQDVAKRAGVSTATVSKVLSNTPYFTDETRDKVLLAVEELGYVPNLAARALSSGKTHIIAVVFPYIYDAIFQDPLVMQILEGIEAECTPQGYNLLLSTPRLSKGKKHRQYNQLIQSRYFDGLIAIDNVPKAPAIEPVLDKNIPAVAIGYNPAPYWVRTDDYSGGQQLMGHITNLGHRRIGIITVRENLNLAVDQRMAGMQAVLAATDIAVESCPVAYSDYSSQGGAKAAKELLENHPDLTAIMCMNDRMAMGATQQVQQMGRRVPADISITGYDNIVMSAIFTPPLTTIDQHAAQIGHTAVRMLIDLLRGYQPTCAVLPTHLIVRGSTAAPRCN